MSERRLATGPEDLLVVVCTAREPASAGRGGERAGGAAEVPVVPDSFRPGGEAAPTAHRFPEESATDMATQAKMAKNRERIRLVKVYADKRRELKEVIRDPKVSFQDKMEAQRRLNALPRDSAPARVRNRCAVTGRPRGYYRKFGVSRIALRDLALQGELPGVIKASW